MTAVPTGAGASSPVPATANLLPGVTVSAGAPGWGAGVSGGPGSGAARPSNGRASSCTTLAGPKWLKEIPIAIDSRCGAPRLLLSDPHSPTRTSP